MPENVYTDQGPGLGSTLFWHAGVPLGTLYAHGQMSRWMLGDAAGRYKRRFGGKSAITRRAGRMSANAWGAFFKPGMGWDLSGRFRAASIAGAARQVGGRAVGVTQSMHEGPFTGPLRPGEPGFFRTKNKTQFRTANLLGKASRLSTGRTIAALARPVVGVGAAYYTWGWLLPLAAEGAVSGFNELAREGEQWRRGTPETSVGFRDMATRERAFTMRQASQMAIHTSQMGVRASLGTEANFLHS